MPLLALGLPPRVVESPSKITTSVPAFAIGFGQMVTVIVSVSVFVLASVTVTIYVVVAAGAAVGFAAVGSFNPVVGDQLYVYGEVPALAVGLPPITTELPAQIAVSGPALAIGNKLTTTSTVSSSVQPTASVTVKI